MTTELLFAETKTIVAREAVYGTDEIDLAANLAVARRYEAFNSVKVTPNGDFRDRNISRPAFSNNRGVYLPRNLGWEITGNVPKPATAGNAPLGLDNLLVASGMTETLVASTTSTYALSTTATAGLTVYHYGRLADTFVWRQTYGTGIRGSMNIAGSIRDALTYTFTGESDNFPVTADTALMKGWSVPLAFFDADGTILLQKTGAGITYTGVETVDDQSSLYLLPQSVITIDSVPFPISAFSLDWGNTVTQRERTSSLTSDAGPVLIGGRNINGDFTLREGGAAQSKALALLHAGSEVSSTIVVTDGLGTGGTTLTITMADLQLRDVTGPDDDNGFAQFTLPFMANANWATQIGDNELTMVWSVTA